MFATENVQTPDEPRNLNLIERGKHLRFSVHFSPDWTRKAYEHHARSAAWFGIHFAHRQPRPAGGFDGKPITPSIRTRLQAGYFFGK